MSTCIDTADRDENNSSAWYYDCDDYVVTKINPCLDCIHMPIGKNQECKLSTAEVIYCKINNHCFRKKNPDVALYVDVSKKKEFIEDDEFKI